MTTLIPSLTAILALVFAVALLNQWRERRQTFQLVWAVGMAFYGIAAASRPSPPPAAGTNRSIGRGT